MSYDVPLQDMRFVLNVLAGLDKVRLLPGGETAAPEIVDAVHQEYARLVRDLAALLGDGAAGAAPAIDADERHSRLARAWSRFVDGRWPKLTVPVVDGGQGMPRLVGAPCLESLGVLGTSFCALALQVRCATAAFLAHGTDSQREHHLPALISGRCTATLPALPAAADETGSAVRLRAFLQPDGSYRLQGVQPLLSVGYVDVADNVVHLVLAHLADAHPALSGLSLFAVPARLPGDDGTPSVRNHVKPVRPASQVGAVAGTTSVLVLGSDAGHAGAGAVGELVGAPHRGLDTLHAAMNEWRFAVGLHAVARADLAVQHAASLEPETALAGDEEVQAAYAAMRALTLAGRANAYAAQGAYDFARLHPDADMRARNLGFYEYMVPIVNGHSAGIEAEVTALAHQRLEGGNGQPMAVAARRAGSAANAPYREVSAHAAATGTPSHAASPALAARASVTGPHYQQSHLAADDLLRLVRDDAGGMALAVAGVMRSMLDEARADAGLAAMADEFERAIEDFESTTRQVTGDGAVSGTRCASAYLALTGTVIGGWHMVRAAVFCRGRIARGDVDALLQDKLAIARCYCTYILSRTGEWRTVVERDCADA